MGGDVGTKVSCKGGVVGVGGVAIDVTYGAAQGSGWDESMPCVCVMLKASSRVPGPGKMLSGVEFAFENCIAN